MGYTSFTKQLVEKYIQEYHPKSVVDLGSQNDFSGPNLPAPYISEWWKGKGIEYACIDLNGENNAIVHDLSTFLPSMGQVDMVLDMGTGEHIGKDGTFDIEATYICWVNKFSLLKKGGIMICENPKSKSWKGHGFSYMTEEFYTAIEKVYPFMNILELGEHAACGNEIDGWNIYCVLQKTSNVFISLSEFKTLPLKQS